MLGQEAGFEQLDLFTDYEARAARQQQEAHARDRERRMQQAVLTIRKKIRQKCHSPGHEPGGGCHRPRPQQSNRRAQGMTDYEDILYLPHHVSPKRQPMSMEDRAAQFSPLRP